MFAAFGPDENMQLYDRGIRRRLAPMLGNDRRRIELAYALQFSLRGTPVLRYGEEIGMGEDLSLPGARRDPYADAVVRRPERRLLHRAGRSSCVRPVISGGEFGYETVNVHRPAARPGVAAVLVRADDPHAAGGPEFGIGTCTPDRHRVPAVLALHYEAPGGVDADPAQPRRTASTRSTSARSPGQDGDPVEMFADRRYEAAGPS